MVGAISVSAYSSMADRATVFEFSHSRSIAWSAGLYLRNDGADGIPCGSSGITSAIAVCTSTAALSRSRFRSNCSVMLVLPCELVEVIESSAAIVVN